MAKCRIGHFAEAQILEALEVDYIDESEVLTPADEEHHIDKHALRGAVRVRLPRPGRGAAPDRRGSGHDPDQGRGRDRRHRRGRAPHARGAEGNPPSCRACATDELFAAAKELRAPYDVVKQTAELGELPVPNFSAGGVATPGGRQPHAPARRARPSSSARASSRARTPSATPGPSSRRSPTTTTLRSWPRSAPGWASRCAAPQLGEIPVEERLAVRGW